MNTLVLHPSDPTTDFLTRIYAGKRYTVINNSISRYRLVNLITAHDRIMMMGHGTIDGLLSGYGHIIDHTFVPLLKTKKLIALWCNADMFFDIHNLNGFYSGMILSEKVEADIFSVPATEEMIDNSNTLIAEALRVAFEQEDIVGAAKAIYKGDDAVITYNRANLFQRP
jgi:hypothetical protein